MSRTRTSRKLAIAFIDITGSVGLYFKLGDHDAYRLAKARLDGVKAEIDGHGGRIIKTVGDGVFAAFQSVLDAAKAARTVHRNPAGPLVHIGIHWGSAIDNGTDLFGDAVNVASRIAQIARPGETLLTQAAANALPRAERAALRSLDMIAVRGRRSGVRLHALVDTKIGAKGSRVTSGMTQIAGAVPPKSSGRWQLVLHHSRVRCEVQAAGASFRLGRAGDCDLVVDGEMGGRVVASREHAIVSWQRDRFVVEDRSTNGTWIASGSGPVIRLRREAAPLTGKGSLGLGAPPSRRGTHVVKFAVVTEGE
ncbi:MAG: adenylate/guanylate cyclase domain-containing protein [Alphaproteobacteria bacterium]|nr:adenylate/guanylate cyclase domain-containing protein [Alphaproteobacteria bacterium]